MELRTRRVAEFVPSRPAIQCAQCGANLFMPEWSEYLDSRRARHLWRCDECGYAFETTIHFAAA
jgi:uncharacterized Zn finger protein